MEVYLLTILLNLNKLELYLAEIMLNKDNNNKPSNNNPNNNNNKEGDYLPTHNSKIPNNNLPRLVLGLEPNNKEEVYLLILKINKIPNNNQPKLEPEQEIPVDHYSLTLLDKMPINKVKYTFLFIFFLLLL